MQTSDTCCVAVTVGDSRLDDMKTVIDAMTGCQALYFEENIGKFHSIPAIRKVSKQHNHTGQNVFTFSKTHQASKLTRNF